MANTEYGQVEEGKSLSREVTRKNRKLANIPGAGVYRHKESGQEAIVIEDPLWGNTQAQAFAQVGFEYVRPAEEGEIKTMPEMAAADRSAQDSSLKGLEARIGQLEGVRDENQRLKDEVEQLRREKKERDEAEAEKAKADAKQAKEDKAHVETAGKANSTNAADESAAGAKANAEKAVAEREQATGNTNIKVNGGK